MIDGSNPTPRMDPDGKKGMFFFLLGCVIAAFALRAWALWAREVVDYDEIYYYILGRNLVIGKGYVLNGLPHTAFPPLYPVFVGLTSLVTDNVRLATSLVTAISGALLPIPVYLLARDIYGKGAALFAAAAAAVWPAFFFFSGKYVAYEGRLYCGSETLFTTLVAFGLVFAWRFARAGGWGRAALAGVFFGSASLVRSEGPVLFAFFFTWLLVDSGVRGVLAEARRAAQTALVAVVMLAVFSPFLVYVHNVEGRWSLGAKLTNNVRVRDTLWNWARRQKVEDFLKEHYRLNDENTQMEDPYWGISDWHREREKGQGPLAGGFGLVFHPDWRWLPVFFEVFAKPPRALVPWYAWFFIIAGIAAGPWDWTRLRWWGFAGAGAAAMALLAVALYVLPRHELPLLVVASVELGNGAAVVTRLFDRSIRALGIVRPRAIAALSIVPAAAMLAAMAVAGVQNNIDGNTIPGRTPGLPAQARDAAVAEWLKANVPCGSTLMCNQPWIAVWAGMEWRVGPYAEPARVVEYAKNRRIAFAVFFGQEKLKAGETNPIEPYIIESVVAGQKAIVCDFRKAWESGS